MGTTRARRTAATAVLALVLGLLGGAGTLTLAAPTAAAVEKGQVVGEVLVPGNVALKVRWFDEDWTFLGARKVTGSIYSLTLAPGTYYLQFTDERPAYNVDKYAPTDLKVTVRSGRKTQKNVRMQPGAAITGTVRGGGRALAGATVVAASADERSFRTKANKKGQFALGGLPDGSYSVFTYDRRGEWVDKSTFVQRLRSRDRRDVAISLGRKGGRLLVDLRAGGQKIRETVFVTAISKASGQFWTVRARRGEASFKGLYPGGYTMVAPGVGNYLPQETAIRGARVKPGRADLASVFTWTRTAASAQGYVVDAEHPERDLEGARVRLFAADGSLLGSARTDATGQFFIGGQLLTQRGVTLVVDPDPVNGSAYLGTQPYRCKFGATELAGIALEVGTTTQVGEVPLPYLPVEQQDGYPQHDPSCAAAEPAV